jgi:long-chain acyl-CoA synthetase
MIGHQHPKYPYFHSLSLAGGIRAAMSRDPTKIALRHRDTKRSYCELVDRFDRVTAAIVGDLGLGSGDHGAIVAKNSIDYIEIVVGASQAGVALATINPRLAPLEIAAICDDAKARVLFVDAESAAALRDSPLSCVETVIVMNDEFESWLEQAAVPAELPVVDERDTFTIPYTSGTTGQPKGVLVPHRSRLLTLFAMAVEYGCYSPDDRFLAIAPLCHGAGMVFALAPVFFGGYAELMDDFDPAGVMNCLATEHITGFFGVPTHFHGMLSLEQSFLDRHHSPHLTTIISNAAPLPQDLKERIINHFGEGLLHETYGSTEAGIVTNLRPGDQSRKQKCVGQPFPCTLVKIVDNNGDECLANQVGELFSLSPYLFNGYWDLPAETKKAFHDGWATVGDLARRDEEGYVYIVDRKKDMVISGGFNIYPSEIEDMLVQHEDILDVAVVGMPDVKWGEYLKAFVVVRSGAALDARKILDFCEGRIAKIKTPKEIAFVDALPRNAGGKVLKTELRSLR